MKPTRQWKQVVLHTFARVCQLLAAFALGMFLATSIWPAGLAKHGVPFSGNRITESPEFYRVLEPVSLELLRYIFARQNATIEGIVAGILQRAQSPGDLRQYAEQLKILHSREDEEKFIEDIGARLSEDARLYYFEYEKSSGDVVESQVGVLILEDGQVLYRDVWDEQITSTLDGRGPEYQSDGGVRLSP